MTFLLAQLNVLRVYLLLLFTLCLPPTGQPIGVNGFSPQRPSVSCIQNTVIEKYSRSSRVWMTDVNPMNSSTSGDRDDGNDVNLPKLKNKLTREFFSIGFPAFIQLAAEPLAALFVCRQLKMDGNVSFLCSYAHSRVFHRHVRS